MLFSCKLLKLAICVRKSSLGESILRSLRVRKWKIMGEINIASHIPIAHCPLYYNIYQVKHGHCGSKDKSTVTRSVNFTIYIKIDTWKSLKWSFRPLCDSRLLFSYVPNYTTTIYNRQINHKISQLKPPIPWSNNVWYINIRVNYN